MNELSTVKAQRDMLHRLMFSLITSGEGVDNQFLNKCKTTPIAIEVFRYYLDTCKRYYDELKVYMVHEAHNS